MEINIIEDQSSIQNYDVFFEENQILTSQTIKTSTIIKQYQGSPKNYMIQLPNQIDEEDLIQEEEDQFVTLNKDDIFPENRSSIKQSQKRLSMKQSQTNKVSMLKSNENDSESAMQQRLSIKKSINQKSNKEKEIKENKQITSYYQNLQGLDLDIQDPEYQQNQQKMKSLATTLTQVISGQDLTPFSQQPVRGFNYNQFIVPTTSNQKTPKTEIVDFVTKFKDNIDNHQLNPKQLLDKLIYLLQIMLKENPLPNTKAAISLLIDQLPILIQIQNKQKVEKFLYKLSLKSIKKEELSDYFFETLNQTTQYIDFYTQNCKNKLTERQSDCDFKVKQIQHELEKYQAEQQTFEIKKYKLDLELKVLKTKYEYYQGQEEKLKTENQLKILQNQAREERKVDNLLYENEELKQKLEQKTNLNTKLQQINQVYNKKFETLSNLKFEQEYNKIIEQKKKITVLQNNIQFPKIQESHDQYQQQIYDNQMLQKSQNSIQQSGSIIQSDLLINLKNVQSDDSECRPPKINSPGQKSQKSPLINQKKSKFFQTTNKDFQSPSSGVRTPLSSVRTIKHQIDIRSRSPMQTLQKYI